MKKVLKAILTYLCVTAAMFVIGSMGSIIEMLLM